MSRDIARRGFGGGKRPLPTRPRKVVVRLARVRDRPRIARSGNGQMAYPRLGFGWSCVIARWVLASRPHTTRPKSSSGDVDDIPGSGPKGNTEAVGVVSLEPVAVFQVDAARGYQLSFALAGRPRARGYMAVEHDQGRRWFTSSIIICPGSWRRGQKVAASTMVQ